MLWLAGVYLRIPILVAPPLAPFISDQLGLTQALTGALTTIPILMLAIGAMPGSLAISRIGPRNTLALAMIIMVIGSAGRALVPETLTLMVASAVMGLGVAMMQPALPALLPRWLAPHHVAMGSAIYMNGMLMGEFIGAGVTLPVLMPLLDQSWRATLLAWSLPALLVAAALYLPRRDLARPVKKTAWLPDWHNPLTLKLGLLLGLSGSMFFGLNAYMGNLLEQQGHFDKLSSALFYYNIAQVFASLMMLKLARSWVGRRSAIIITAALSILGTTGAILLEGWWTIASATLMSFVAGILLILLVALPPLLVRSEDTGRLSAGTFLVGYTVAFSVPMLGGLLADVTGDTRHAIAVMIGYSLLVLPLAFTLDLKRKKDQPKS
ncbi:CP family cyanate transporter-like MFS transporter [Marinobacter persicus]|uniref:CP family cyanate transporter-like MFS transporter n=1 Tax=Marinobacter persicus TaxID=930118 RepID=A0A2S6GAR8_9GAMM|nr:CP family cyanate transporter-like MFS transporter [Marinobacter persicus]PPK56243.1 CP family cyanate transporter-like MFS transporter [Marinobacter persicus]PPK59838.1 CP family cyanate transporter-like MFS transporter [Marinobacter persicus]